MDNFLLRTIEIFYGIESLEVDNKSQESFLEFVHNPNVLLLQGFLVDQNKLSYSLKVQSDKTQSIIFYKTSLKELTAQDGVRSVNIITLSNTPAESLYQILRQVYTPLLTEGNDLMNNKIQQNLIDLESNLRILADGKGNAGKLHVILSVEDEIDYWKTIAQRKVVANKDKEAALAFCELFEEINEELRALQTSPVSESRELSENISGLLDDIWRHNLSSYPQDRMKHMFDVIGHVLISKIQNILTNLEIWKVFGDSRDNEVLANLSESLKAVQSWTNGCKSLTETYWPNHALHPWNGKPYIPMFCLHFENRIKEVFDIKSTHHQLNKLLTNEERRSLKTERLFEPFQEINIWSHGSKQIWESAITKFSASLRPTENKIAEKLKPRLHNSSTKQMLYEFMRYKMLIQRPHVKEALNNELEIFLSSLGSLLKNIQNQIDSDDTSHVKMYRPPEMSHVIQEVQWAKQMESKVKDIYEIAEKYLREFDGSTEVLNLSAHVSKELKNMYTQLHEEWSRDLQAQVKDGTLRLSVDKPVVEFSWSSKMMVVHYNPRVVSVESEVRNMAALGLSPPPLLKEAIDNVIRFLHHARALQQVASFHNTLGERMIPSTRPMMLQAALDLSSLVQDQKAVYWDNIDQVSQYSDMLKKAVFKLESQNSYLTNQHVMLRNIVESLMDTDLLAKQSEWKKKIKDMREIIEKVETAGYKNTELWRAHWDWQLYKALECQYIKTLLSLHKHFPHVKVDLVLRGREVRLQPPIEEIRVQHYHQLRRLISLPTQFVGVQDNINTTESIFTSIIDKHSWMGNKSVRQLEATLSVVERRCVTWTGRAALACLTDLDELCREQLKEPEHWEFNFKACKAYGQAVAKTTFDDEKVDWISIGTATLRREFEAQVRNLWACLISSLQASCRADTVLLDGFIANAMLVLENKILPKNTKELSEISAKQHALKEKMPEMEKTVEALRKKGRMLHTWGGDTSVESALQEWVKVQQLMVTQQQVFEHQAEIVKSSLNGEWENLNMNVEAWSSRWTQTRSRFDEMLQVTYVEMCDRCQRVCEAQAQWEKFVAEKDELLKECEKFSLKLADSEMWKQAGTMISDDSKLWTIFKEYNDDYQTIAEQDWIIFHKKLHLIDEFVSNWCNRLEPYTPVTLFVQQELDKYSDITPLLKYLRGSDFTERHWREVYSLLGIEYKKPDTLQVKDLLTVAGNIKNNVKILQKICATACNEAAIRGALTELELWFAGARFTLTYYKDKAGNAIPIVKDFKEILNKIEEQQWIVGSVRGGGEAGGDACAAWEARLRQTHSLVRDTHHVQRRWLYLEPILSNDDGELGVKFRKVDQGFRQVGRILEADSRLSALLQSTRLQPMLDSISDQLHACQSALNEYIDDKRKIFPRFYFLSDDDLLELLGQARSGAEGREAVMQNHLKKLFPGITGVKLGPQSMSITVLCSHYGETFTLEHPVDIDCSVEVWLKNLENEMRSSLKSATLKCVISNSTQDQDVFALPVQILCLAQNIQFTEKAERAIVSKELHKLKANIEKENAFYAEIEVEEESEKQKRQALILQCVYYVTIVQLLIDNNITTTNHWLWQKQLRFYLLNTQDVIAKMGLAQLSYSYEYLGVNTGQFVRTELADECFLILTQAFHLGLVGNPFGPAGTGKTESVKALGGLVGRLVLVFNCDEVMDAECMGRLLTGLALSGAWGCFDEFNRLTADTLSTVSQQFTSLLAAISDHSPTAKPMAVLNGKQVSVSGWCGVAATMNPLGRGYGGRRELPAALERVLRPAAMMRPHPRPLIDNLLYARAIGNAAPLADDLHQVFSMARELLSGQRHYDWGLRALKAAVGSCAGSLHRTDPLAGQRATLRRVLRDNNISKLTSPDALRFEAILSVVFHDVPEEQSYSDPILPALRDSTKSLGLMINERQIQKCVEVHEQLRQRMGIVIVGPPGSGKTTIRHLLKMALTQQGKNIVEYVISPKAMSRNCLLGCIDHDTRQWTDGVISATALEISNQPSDVWSWVVCDGDVDPEWIEALNSVLDDNRLLTLPSGWRIQFGPNVNFLFETDNLEHASPATVSRMGIILLSDEDSCADEVLNVWLEKIDTENEMAKMAIPLLQKVIKKCLQWSSSHKNDFLLKIFNVSMVKQILTQFEYIIKNIDTTLINMPPEEFVYLAIHRSVVCNLKQNAVENLMQELSEVWGAGLGSGTGPGQWRDEVVYLSGPGGETGPGQWRDDVVYLSGRLAAAEPGLRAVTWSPHAHLLLTGPPACGKTILAEYVLKDTNNAQVININCTPVLEPSDIIRELKKHSMVRSPGGGGQSAGAVLLMRSLHRAPRDTWGSSSVQAFLLQLIQHGGFWEESAGGGEAARGVVWCAVTPVRVVATAHLGGGALCGRLTAALTHLALGEPDDDELLELIKHYLKQNSGHKSITENEISSISKNILSVYKEVLDTFYSQKHYKWNAADLKKWCENMKWYSPSGSDDIISAIHNEANCIFRDRLLTDDEKSEFDSIMNKYLKSNKNESVYYATKLRGTGVYMEAVDYGDWYQSTQKIIKQCLTEHEYSVFGDNGAEVCAELAALCPAMARACNGGGVVCVGCAGVGRRAAVHIVGAALTAGLYIVNHANEFTAQFKNAVSTASEQCSRSLVVLGPGAANTETLGAIEARLNSQQLLNDSEKLGIVIMLDKEQDDIWELMDKFPFLYKECHMMWQVGWCQETLRRMPQLIIQRLIKEDVAEGSPLEPESILTEHIVNIHYSLEAEWTRTPARYVHFIRTYYRILRRKKTALLERERILAAGVEALRAARGQVASLEGGARTQEAALSVEREAAARALDQITATVRSAAAAKDDMHALRNNIQLENQKLQIRKKEIEVELASVEPVIAAARAAVGEIRTEALSEVRSLRAPPDVVRDVLEGVLRLMGIADTSWHSMKNFLSKRGVKEDIRCMDASQMSPEAVQSVQRLLERRGTSFDEKTSRRASAACAPLAAWVRANVAYADALARVQPLQAQQRDLHKNLQEAEDQLSALTSGLETVDERVSSLKAQLGQHTREAAALEHKLNEATTTLNAALGLLEQLAHEYSAWESDLENISKEISELSVRSLLAAAFVTYLPDVTEPQSREMLKKWSDIIGFDDNEFSVIDFLSTTEKQLKWDADGLPMDRSAVKNAVIIDQFLEQRKCGFTPFIIDPDGDALVWLKNNLSDLSVEFVSQHSDKLLTAIQHALRFGRVLVLTEMESIRPPLITLLLGLPAANVNTPHAAFRLVLYSRDPTAGARLPVHTRALLSLLYFTARVDGLTDQLVHYALRHRDPEVNEKSRELKLKKAVLQKQQYELQENLLRDLSSNSDILHDANLLSSLKKTRSTGAVIAESLQSARALEALTEAACDAYEPSARRAAVLALAVRDLTAQRPLIALPVDAVLDVYVEALQRGGNSKEFDSQEVVKYFTRRVIERVLLGLRKHDKYVIVLHLLKQVYEDLIPEKLWKVFIESDEIMILVDNESAKGIKLKYPWIPDTSVRKMAVIQSTCVELFEKLVLHDSQYWKVFQVSEDVNVLHQLKLSQFEVVLVVGALRPEHLYRAIITFVDTVLGTGVMSAGGEVSRASRCAHTRPVLLLSAHAADHLYAHAASQARSLVQMEPGEGPAAWERALQSAGRAGLWLHLNMAAAPFTPELQTFLAGVATRTDEESSPEFRVWVTSEDRDIPPLVVNACLNVIIEAPEGIKNNVMNTLSVWGNIESADVKLVRTLACLALLHAVLQERRAYIPEGWSRWYPFEWGDVSACGRAVRGAGGGVGCAAGVCGALYGGRVCARADGAVLNALVHACLADHVHAHAWLPRGLTQPLPFSRQLQSYMSAFNDLPSMDTAAMLGLPANCKLAWENKTGQNIVNSLKELSTRVDVNQKTDETISLKPLLMLWKKLMSGSPLLKGELYDEKEHSGWWWCVCAGEVRDAGRAVRGLHAHLVAARGQGHSLGKVPDEWQLLWPGPDAPDKYMKELCHRAQAAVTRARGYNHNGQEFPKELDLRSLLYPRRALWALRAHEADRLHRRPRDLILQADWVTGGHGDEGVSVCGLRLCGAEWREGRLQAVGERDAPHAPAPPLRLRYTLQDANLLTPDGFVEVPVYSSESREEVVFHTRAPTAASFDGSTVTLNAVALFIADV